MNFKKIPLFGTAYKGNAKNADKANKSGLAHAGRALVFQTEVTDRRRSPSKLDMATLLTARQPRSQRVKCGSNPACATRFG